METCSGRSSADAFDRLRSSRATAQTRDRIRYLEQPRAVLSSPNAPLRNLAGKSVAPNLFDRPPNQPAPHMKRAHRLLLAIAVLLAHSSLGQAASQRLVAGSALQLALAPSAPPVEVVFTNDGSRLVALRAETGASQVEIQLEATAVATFGAYQLDGALEWTFRSESAPSQVCDRLPQFPTTWKLTFTQREGSACTVQLRVEDQGPAPAIHWAEAPGRLVVRDAGRLRLHARAELGLTATQPSLELDETIAPQSDSGGEIVFQLPAGYWRLVAAGDEGVAEIRSVLIPVSSGAETLVAWPTTRSPLATPSLGLTELTLRGANADHDTGRILVAAPILTEPPRREAVHVLEAGQPGEVLAVESIPAELHVVVLFDSSLSMRKIFAEAQTAALRFVESLPPGCTVDFIDFDTKVKELPSSERVALLAAIRQIQADGSTKLYDSIMRGLAKCADHRRSALVVFTDGFDAQIEDPGFGSRASQGEVFAAVTKAQVPLYTIAYGEKPDEKTLQRLATESHGNYFRAQADTIGSVFEQIRGLVDHDFRITYRRPVKAGPSNIPVITIVLDVSGSMNMDPREEGCGFRIEKAKDLLRNFFGQLPGGSVVQVFTFSSAVNLIQVRTSDPARLRRCLCDVEAGGSTETLEAARAALASLTGVPSRNRFLLFITDAALQLESDQRAEFAKVLANLQAQNIRSLWVGMVPDVEAAPFAEAAKLSGGSYVVSPGTESLTKALATLHSSLVETSGSSTTALEVLVAKPGTTGEKRFVGGGGCFPLPASSTVAAGDFGSLEVTLGSSIVSEEKRPSHDEGSENDETGAAPEETSGADSP